jgi:hypothetical protein
MTEKRQFCPLGHDTFIFGRDSSYRCLECKRMASAQARAARLAAEEAERHAEFQARRAAWERDHERERQRNLAAGGDAEIYQRWEDAHSAALRKDYDICQWDDWSPDRPSEFPHRRTCFRRLASDGNVYCKVHNRQLERRKERELRQREASTAKPKTVSVVLSNGPDRPKEPKGRFFIG